MRSPNSPQCSTLCSPLRSPRRNLQPRAPSFQRVLERYDDVNIRTKPSKVQDYASTQVGLGHLLDDNEFRTLPDTYAEISGEVRAMLRCG